MFKKILLLITFFIVLLPGAVLAQSESSSADSIRLTNIVYEKVNPDKIFNYSLKRLGEKLSLLFSTNEQKANQYKKIMDARLAELKYIIDNKQMAYFEIATQRYFTTVGQYTNFLIQTNLNDQKATVKEELSLNIPILESLRDSFDSKTAEWRFVQDDINYTKSYIDQL